VRVHRSSRRRLIPNIALFFLLFAASPAAAQTGPVQYGYDELGRLVVVSDGAGNTGIFNYDAVGNLLSIERIDPGQLGAIAIVKITPTQGRVGSAVSIFGKGFGATPAQNTVTFNGGAATVTSASPNRLQIAVPSTAVDGPISVTAAAGTATSAQSFRVLRPFTVTPNGASVSAGGSLQFSATNPDGSAAPVTWAVNDLPWGTPSVGTISVSGLYTPPPYVNVSFGVTITATDQSDVTTTASVTATVLPRRLTTAAQGVSVSFAKPTVSNVQASVSATVGAGTVTNSLRPRSASRSAEPRSPGTFKRR
jgi:YD repeat-containing protein